MKHAEIAKRALIVLCAAVLVCCSGCGAGQAGSKGDTNDTWGNGDQETSASQSSGPSEGSPAGQLFAKAIINGTVVEFSDQGCVISPTEYAAADGGSLAIAAMPGHEDPEKNVTVQYEENCKFQIAVIDPSTGAVDIKDATVADVKKQSSLIIQGSLQDELHVTATLVTIARYQSF